MVTIDDWIQLLETGVFILILSVIMDAILTPAPRTRSTPPPALADVDLPKAA